MYDLAHARSRTVHLIGGNFKPDLTLKTCLVFFFIRLFIYIWSRKSALVHLANYQLCNLFFSLEFKIHILETNSHFTPELLKCALGHLTLSSLAYTARLLGCQHPTLVVSMKFPFIGLFFVLVEGLLVLGCCPSLYATFWIPSVSHSFQGWENRFFALCRLLTG
jgi:hypothetical protein